MLISGIYKLKLPVGNYKVSHRNTVREDKGYKGGTTYCVSPLVYIIFASGGENKLSVRSRMSAFAPCLHGIYINHQWKTSYGIYF